MARVLIVEDSEEMSDLLSSYFSRLGFEVDEAKNGLDGLKAAQKLRPDLIVLDLMMPVASGDFTLGYIRSTESLKNIPVIITSAHPKARAIADKLHASCLEKPFSLPELAAMVESLGVRADRKTAPTPTQRK
ncbi:MAG: response regulator [Anaerolineae bacterium]|nr:response regulator [Anaerolineae bacterium]